MQEFNSLLKLHDIPQDQVYSSLPSRAVSHLIVRLPSLEVVNQIAGRSVMIKTIYELWGFGLSHDDTLKSVLDYTYISKERMAPYLSPAVTYSVKACGYGVSMNTAQQQKTRERYFQIPFEGKVQLKNPEHEFWIIENWGNEWLGVLSPEDRMTSPPLGMYFGMMVTEGSRDLINQFTLKKRQYLGPTSMCAELSFIMANQGLCRNGSLILDTFAGTGSILVACSHFGAACIGTDIDIRVLKGQRRGKLIGSDPFSNFRQYSLPPPDLIRCDTSTAPTRQVPLYDAIICDPPYGIRAGGRKAGSNNEVVKAVPVEKIPGHIPQTQPYEIPDMMADLLDNAAKWLVMGGRLVYLLPSGPTLTHKDIPSHPLLKLVSQCEEKLTMKVSRHLITMEKVCHYDYTRAKEFRESAKSTVNVFSLEEAEEEYQQMLAGGEHKESNRSKKARLRREHRQRQKKVGGKSNEEGRREDDEDVEEHGSDEEEDTVHS